LFGTLQIQRLDFRLPTMSNGATRFATVLYPLSDKAADDFCYSRQVFNYP